MDGCADARDVTLGGCEAATSSVCTVCLLSIVFIIQCSRNRSQMNSRRLSGRDRTAAGFQLRHCPKDLGRRAPIASAVPLLLQEAPLLLHTVDKGLVSVVCVAVYSAVQLLSATCRCCELPPAAQVRTSSSFVAHPAIIASLE